MAGRPKGSRNVKGRKLDKKIVISKTGVSVEFSWCRKCMQMKRPSEFFVATDFYLDSNGFMSICKDCANDMYERTFKIEGSVERTILKMCRVLNIRYDERAIEVGKKRLASIGEKGNETGNFFGYYKASIGTVSKDRDGSLMTDAEVDLTFVEPTRKEIMDMYQEQIEDKEYYQESWGVNYTEDEYHFLEAEFAKWKKTTKCDTQSEEILVREICHKQLEIRNARIEGKSVDGLVKGLQEIMKNSALTPALQNAANSGKNADTFGVWVKDIEQFTPAEWFENQSKYRDMDGMEEDKKDIIRSIGNFITGSRDFNTTDLEEINDADDGNDDLTIPDDSG